MLIMKENGNASSEFRRTGFDFETGATELFHPWNSGGTD